MLLSPQEDMVVVLCSNLEWCVGVDLFAPGKRLGMLGMESHTRRRNRLNARIDAVDPATNTLTLTVLQSFGNCPKYIQVVHWHACVMLTLDDVRNQLVLALTPAHRHPQAQRAMLLPACQLGAIMQCMLLKPGIADCEMASPARPDIVPFAMQARHLQLSNHASPQTMPQVWQTSALQQQQIDAITAADCMFVASHLRLEDCQGRDARSLGPDVSHRGGPAGFVRVVDGTHLQWADYIGNYFFQTLGNIVANGQVGLLFIDYQSGTTLQVLGEKHSPTFCVGSYIRLQAFIRLTHCLASSSHMFHSGRLHEIRCPLKHAYELSLGECRQQVDMISISV